MTLTCKFTRFCFLQNIEVILFLLAVDNGQELGGDHVDGHLVFPTLGDYDVGILLAWLNELVVAWLNRSQVLGDDPVD